MAFLTPLVFMALAAVTVPVLIHLIQRERKQVIDFPSLMFIRRIPYQSVRRRRIRHWPLLLVRAFAIALIVAAFARPFFSRGDLAAASFRGSRSVVILLDTSASMGYADQWSRARADAKRIVSALGSDDEATLVLFARSAEENVRATADRARLMAAIDAARVGSSSTRFGPALKMAASILGRSNRSRREVVLISDFQRTGWTGADDVHFAKDVVVTPVSVASADRRNVAVTSVALTRAQFSGEDRVTVTAAVANRSVEPLRSAPVTLDIDGRQIGAARVDAEPGAAASVAFPPFTLADPHVRGRVRAGSDAMPSDNTFEFVLDPVKRLNVLIVNNAADAEGSWFLTRALGIGTDPAFASDLVTSARLTPMAFDKRDVVVLNDAPFPPAAAAGALKSYVERGGGLLVVLGEHSSWPDEERAIFPGRIGAIVDREGMRGGTLGMLDYSHPVFDVFKAPRSGDFAGTRVLRYRTVLEPAATDHVLARFDDGGIAAVERRFGRGRVVAWTSPLDDTWTDLPLKPVFLPLVHQLLRYLGRFEEPAAWYTVDQAIDIAARLPPGRDRIVLTPSGSTVAVPDGAGSSPLELSEQGIYELRLRRSADRHPAAIAVNIDPAESDLTPMDPRELVAAITGVIPSAADRAVPAPPATPQEAERRQALWWYLLLAGLFLLAGETMMSNRLSHGRLRL